MNNAPKNVNKALVGTIPTTARKKLTNLLPLRSLSCSDKQRVSLVFLFKVYDVMGAGA